MTDRLLPTIVLLTLTGLALATSGCEDQGPFADLRVEANPHSTIAPLVRFTSSSPATSRVAFGADGAPAFAVVDDAPATEHEIAVIGMRPETTYELWISVTEEDGAVIDAEPISFTTGALPFTAAELDVTVLDEARMQPGWTLINMHVADLLAPTVAAMVDAEGAVVWYRYLGPETNFGGVELSLTDEDHVLIGGTVPPTYHPLEVDLSGAVVWEGPEQPEPFLADGSMHHAMQKLPNGHYLTMRYEAHGANLVDVIEELTPDNEIAWQWNASDHLAGSALFPLHGNMVQADLGQDVVYFHAQQVSRLYQIDRATGEVRWIFGRTGDFPIDTTPRLPYPWFQHAHAPEVLPGGTILVYDNGSVDQRPFSRVIEYALDEQAGTAEVVWVYPPEVRDDPWYNFAWGDADRLPNGNTLITSGSIAPQDSPSRIFEVTPDGEIVWEAWMRSEVEGDLAGSFMSERIPVLVEVL